MPRPMGELRRLLAEYNSLVPLAQARGIRGVRVRSHFHMARPLAREKVRWLRETVAPFFAPTMSLDSTDTFAVEIEAILPRGTSRSQLAQMIQAEGVMCMEETLNHAARNHWKLVTDGSLLTRGMGYDRVVEAVAPVLRGEAGLTSIHKVCTVMNRIGSSITKECGLHVHVGAAHRDVNFFRNIMTLTWHFADAIDSFMSPSRRRGISHWCQPHRVNLPAMRLATNLSEVAGATGLLNFSTTNVRGSYRYRAVNLLAFRQHGTCEFRQHQGTTDAKKTEMWVRACLKMCSKAGEAGVDIDAIIAAPQTLEGFFDFIKADDAERAYFSERRNFFSASTSTQLRRSA